MDCMSLLGFAACAPDAEFRASLPFQAFDIDRDAIPPLLRRRTSQATRMAFSAADRACRAARRRPAELPSVFACVGGEIQTTDLLCIELAKPDGVISPSAFHNSVHNTAVGYWSIVHQCTRPASALAAGSDTFAMALLEAWCQLASQGGEVLVVCYDETWPDYLAPGKGGTAFASALVLAAGPSEDACLQLGRPELGAEAFPAEWEPLAKQTPVLAVIPLLELAATGGNAQSVSLSVLTASCWQVLAKPINFQISKPTL